MSLRQATGDTSPLSLGRPCKGNQLCWLLVAWGDIYGNLFRTPVYYSPPAQTG